MKPVIKITFAFLLLLIIACNKDKGDKDENPTPTETNDYSTTAKIDGNSFTSVSSIVTTKIGQQIIFGMTATDAYGNFIKITLYKGYTKEGTYQFGNDSKNINVISYNVLKPNVLYWTSVQETGTGTMTVTKDNDNYVEGTFSFEGVSVFDSSTKKITEGKFKAKKNNI